MREVKFLYPIFFIGLMYIFHLLYLSGHAPFLVLDLALLMLGAGGYLYPRTFSYSLFVISWATLYPLMTFIYKLDYLNSALTVLLFNCVIIGCVRYKNTIESIRREYDSSLNEKEKITKAHSLKVEEMSLSEDHIREEELTVARVYEITKKLSSILKLEEIFNTFGILLRDNFIFRRARLIALKTYDSGLKVDKIFKVAGASEKSPNSADMDYEALMRIFSQNSRDAAFFSRKADDKIFDDLRIEEDVKTFTAVPLLSEKRIIGILAVEDLPFIDFERAIIVSMQFALEIKKVLLYEKVEELAITDSLTGLYVRRYFLERFEEELNRSSRYKFNCAFIMIDIDNFKKCNDTYGHLVGDVLLKDVGRTVRDSVREIDLVARYGGEEFSVILPETKRDGAKLVAERIRSRIQENVFKAYDEKLNLTVSIGISVYPEDSNEARGLIDKADRALYVAKRSGKNIVCEYKK